MWISNDWRWLTGICLCLLAMVGCGESPRNDQAGENAPNVSGPFVIGVVLRDVSAHDGRLIGAGMAEAAEQLAERNVEVRIDQQPPAPENQPDTQAQRVRELLRRGVDGLILMPQHADRLNGVIEQVVEAGVPVVLVGSGASTDQAAGFVGSDNRKAGRTAARYLATLLGESGQLAVVSYLPGPANTTARQLGFTQALDAHAQIHLITTPPPAQGAVESAHEAASDFLDAFYAQHGAMPDGLFCPNEPTTLGTLHALRDRGLAGRVPLVGVGSSKILVDALADDQIDALLVEDPMAMGRSAVQSIVARLQGRSFEKRIVTEVILVTPESMSYGSVADRLGQGAEP